MENKRIEELEKLLEAECGKSVKCIIVCESGKELERTMRNDRLVAIA